MSYSINLGKTLWPSKSSRLMHLSSQQTRIWSDHLSSPRNKSTLPTSSCITLLLRTGRLIIMQMFMGQTNSSTVIHSSSVRDRRHNSKLRLTNNNSYSNHSSRPRCQLKPETSKDSSATSLLNRLLFSSSCQCSSHHSRSIKSRSSRALLRDQAISRTQATRCSRTKDSTPQACQCHQLILLRTR
jgi:hypothetical protein